MMVEQAIGSVLTEDRFQPYSAVLRVMTSSQVHHKRASGRDATTLSYQMLGIMLTSSLIHTLLCTEIDPCSDSYA